METKVSLKLDISLKLSPVSKDELKVGYKTEDAIPDTRKETPMSACLLAIGKEGVGFS